MTYSIVIHGRLPGCNEYIEACRKNRYEAARMKRETQELIRWQIYRLPKLTKPVKIAFRWIEPNARRDYDNITYGRKFILDALQEAGKLPNDNRKYVRGFSDEFAVDKDDPRIEMKIEEIKDVQSMELSGLEDDAEQMREHQNQFR